MRESGGFYFDGFTVSERERERERERDRKREKEREREKMSERDLIRKNAAFKRGRQKICGSKK